MTTPSPEETDSPKRKRITVDGPSSDIRSIRLDTTNLLSSSPPSEGGDSPRSKVARRLQGLRLDRRERTPATDILANQSASDEAPGKHLRLVDAGGYDRSDMSGAMGFGTCDDDKNEFWTQNESAYTLRQAEPSGKRQSSRPSRSTAALSALSEAQFGLRRPGTPPIQGHHVVDSQRANLTWHANEITGHLISGPDDDGTGINGIGFKPTPAMASHRAEKRRKQIAQYKSREAKEARAKRSERRNANMISRPERSSAGSTRHVRFLEAEAAGV